MERSTLLWCILGRDIAGDTSLDPLRSSGDTGSVWIDASVEDEGPPAARLASTARGTPITTQDDVAPQPPSLRGSAVQSQPGAMHCHAGAGGEIMEGGGGHEHGVKVKSSLCGVMEG